MRAFVLYFMALTLLSCQSQKKLSFQKLKNSTYTLSHCFSDGKCNLEIKTKSSLFVRTDEFNNSYIEIKPGDQTILKYSYKRNEIPNTADANYEEVLYIELKEQDTEINLKDDDLQIVKMTYGRLCYCKGTSGYFPVKTGDLSLKIAGKALVLKSNFEIKNIPQLINIIDITVPLK